MMRAVDTSWAERKLRQLAAAAEASLEPAAAASCVACGDRGWVIEPDGGAGRARPCACRAPNSVERRWRIWEEAGVPYEYRKPFEDLAAWPTDRARPGFDLRTWSGDPQFVVIQGPFGIGKTQLAVEIFDRLVLAGVLPRYRFVTAAEVPDMCFGDPDNRSTRWQEVLFAPGMVLDDVGRNYFGNQSMAVSRLICHRWQWKLPTIIPTNLEKGLIDDGAVMDRLASGANVKLGGESRRWS